MAIVAGQIAKYNQENGLRNFTSVQISSQMQSIPQSPDTVPRGLILPLLLQKASTCSHWDAAM